MARIKPNLMKQRGFYTDSWRNFVFIWFCIAILSGCEMLGIETNRSNLDSPIEGYNEIMDVEFGKVEDLRLDLHLPMTTDSTPAEVVILLHGGGWISGDKSWLKPTVDILKEQRKNLAIVNINYRLSSGQNNLLALQLTDMADVVSFLTNNAEKFNIRKDQYRLAGFSAGGHIALTYAYKSTEATIGAVVAVSAPTELSLRAWLSKTLWSRVELLTGNTYGGPINIFKNDSPFYLATSRSPRTILVYGEADDLVSPRQGELLADKLRLLRVPYAYHLVKGETHELSAPKAAQYIMESYR